MSTENPLTPLQERVLACIEESIREQGYPPTIREIGRRCRIKAPSSVAYHLRVLEERGLIKREGTLSRGLSLAQDPSRLPLIGRVGAGAGQIAQEDIEDHVTLDKNFMLRGDFLLRVHGDSMNRAGIVEGDLVQVRKQDNAEDGDVIVAVVDNEEGVVKRLERDGDRWLLVSANPAYPPIEGPFQIVGKVVGLIRRYGKH